MYVNTYTIPKLYSPLCVCVVYYVCFSKGIPLHLLTLESMVKQRKILYCFTGRKILDRCGNDPSAGSPTETLLRLHLPLNDKV